LRRLSIGLRLTLWYVAVFAVAQLVFGAGMYFILRQSLYSITDDALHDQIDDLTHFLEAQKKNATVAKLQEEVSETYLIEHSGDYLQIYGESGDWIFRSSALARSGIAPIEPRLVEDQQQPRDVVFDGHAFRLLTQRVEVNRHAYTVQTGLPIDQVLKTLSLFRRFLLLFAPLLLLAAATVGYWLSRKALSPVDLITRTAQNISARNLSDRLDTPKTGDELQRLSDTLNGMLSRIEAAFLRITQFTADASHELRTPISLIRTEAEIALRKSRGEAEYRQALRHILLESEQTSVLIEELLTLARADSGRESLQLRPVDLRAAVLRTGNEWRQMIESRGLRFDVTADEILPMVTADRSALSRLLAILLDNAQKYTSAPGKIGLEVGKVDGKAFVAVRDTGIGISQKDQAKIFERFYRVDTARSRSRGGAGIGLSIAHWIVQQHDGTITVQSEIGKGSTFIVEFPLRRETSKSETDISAIAGAPAGSRQLSKH
jgi:heavy metal sensor kinase